MLKIIALYHSIIVRGPADIRLVTVLQMVVTQLCT